MDLKQAPVKCEDVLFSRVSSTFCRTGVAGFHPALGVAQVLFLDCRLRWSQRCQPEEGSRQASKLHGLTVLTTMSGGIRSEP
ncbi:hypothetical protein Q9966_005366 [Columba livia]|nr:hypothetical protein Q9966_005366 [Columba livia]